MFGWPPDGMQQAHEGIAGRSRRLVGGLAWGLLPWTKPFGFNLTVSEGEPKMSIIRSKPGLG